MTWGSGNPAGQEVFVDEDDRHRLSDLPEEGVRRFGGHSLQLSQHAPPMVRKPYRDVSGGFYQALTYGNCAPRSSRTTRITVPIGSASNAIANTMV